MSDIVTLFYRDAEQVWGQGDLGAIDENYAEDLVFHSSSQRDGLLGRAVYRQAVADWRAAFPDTQALVIGQVADEGNLVIGRWLVTGTHIGFWRDVPPSHKRVEIEELAVFRFEGDLIDEIWLLFDVETVLARLGVLAVAAPQS
ncbi:MAG: ester cyclase [Aggregatilineales bacterium]